MGASNHPTTVPENFESNDSDDVAADGGDDDVIQGLYDSVSLQRGLGYSGTCTELVERDCETCGYDRMVRRTEVFPETSDEVVHYCQNPNCPDSHQHEVKNLGYRFRL